MGSTGPLSCIAVFADDIASDEPNEYLALSDPRPFALYGGKYL